MKLYFLRFTNYWTSLFNPTKVLDGLRSKEKAAATLFNVEKAYKKIKNNWTIKNHDTGTKAGVYQRNGLKWEWEEWNYWEKRKT